MFESTADIASLASQNSPTVLPKPRRCRRLTLTKVDRRSRLGRRIDELRCIFFDALGGADALSPTKRLKVDDAAQLKAVAELARGAFMRDSTGSLDDIVRAERKADQSIRALGISDAKPKATSPLVDHFSRPPAREAG